MSSLGLLEEADLKQTIQGGKEYSAFHFKLKPKKLMKYVLLYE